MEDYNAEEEDAIPHTSYKQTLENRTDFNVIMDDFLTGYKVLGKKAVKKSKEVNGGMAELDEVRRQLGKVSIS